jgi:hypothetical protein
LTIRRPVYFQSIRKREQVLEALMPPADTLYVAVEALVAANRTRIITACARTPEVCSGLTLHNENQTTTAKA